MATKFEITFLGTGTSIGVPVIGCDCDVCTSDDPKNKRTRSSILVETDAVSFVVDTGPDFRNQCLRENITELDAALFTHPHSDHIMGFDDLRRFTVEENARIGVYAPPECMKRIRLAFDYAFEKENHHFGYLKPDPRVILCPFNLCDLKISPLPVTHGNVETIGFLFEQKGKKKLAYIPDAKTLSDETMELIQDVEILILDALHEKEHWTHLSIPESIEIAKEVKANETWFTHFSCRVDYKKVGPTLPMGVELAWDGLKLGAD